MDIQLFNVDPNTRQVTLKIQSKKVTGISKLFQIVLLSLLNTPGQDVLDPNKGGGLPDLIGDNIDAEDSTEIFAEISRKVRKTEVEVINDQIGLDLPADEKLRELKIVGLTRGETIDQIFIRVRVTNQAGQSQEAIL